MKRSILYIIGLLLVTSMGCKDDENVEGVPNVPVNITLSLNLPQWQPLSTPGGWAYVTGGSRGIIVYRESLEDFTAMDRHCPYQSNDQDRVSVLDDNITAMDTVSCGSQFIIFDGSLSQGPASVPLRTYQTSYDASINELRIFN